MNKFVIGKTDNKNLMDRFLGAFGVICGIALGMSFIALLAAASWLIVCGIVFLISVVLGITFSFVVATMIWFVIIIADIIWTWTYAPYK